MMRRHGWVLGGLFFAGLSLSLHAAGVAGGAFQVTQADSRNIALTRGKDIVTLRFVTPNVIEIHAMPGGTQSAASVVMNPKAHLADIPATIRNTDLSASLGRSAGTVAWDKHTLRISVLDGVGKSVLQIDPNGLLQGAIEFDHDASDPLYGIGGYDAAEPSAAGLLRSGVQMAMAGEQGHPGAPFIWSTRGYGVLVDTVGARFDLRGTRIHIDRLSRKDVRYDVLLGSPPQLFSALATLSGPAPLFPKWAMGFTNTQWGIDQTELLDILSGYRARHIPLDNVTLDFDWKAWGEDNYGEFRWNAVKFPGGPNGSLKAMLDRHGLHLTGIMKPRIHVDTQEGRYADAHHYWVEGRPAAADYFSLKPIRELDFNQPAVRAWFFNAALKHAFSTGIVGWWNDEADDTGDDTQFMNMQRALYDGQHSYSPLRVWSINRAFYLGAQRYAYGLWSGDIDTGFDSMAAQRERMLSAINVGEMKWGMDGGGFKGQPDPENYARWVEFGAFTPVFRVHGTFGEKRQPWLYGAVAERAASDAIRLRYTLIPYIYAYEHQAMDGVGLVRPLLFDFPDDPQVRNDVEAWMFGDSLLVSPVVGKGQTEKNIYLPAGRWIDYFSGHVYNGGQTIRVAVDSATWRDIPLFIREGAIIPTQTTMDFVGQHPVTSVDVDIFPAARATRFDYYDDDGVTYAYEHGAYFMQSITQQLGKHVAEVTLKAPHMGYKPGLRYYILRVHLSGIGNVRAGASALPSIANAAALRAAEHEGWCREHDRYGEVVLIKVRAQLARTLSLD